MRYKPGYYLVCPAGTSDTDIAWTDGEAFYMPGTEKPIDLGLFVMMSEGPINLQDVPAPPFVDPFDSNVGPEDNGDSD